MLIVCMWHKPQTIIVGCKVGSADYRCEGCGLVDVCLVRGDWLTFSKDQQEKTTTTSTICPDCYKQYMEKKL